MVCSEEQCWIRVCGVCFNGVRQSLVGWIIKRGREILSWE